MGDSGNSTTRAPARGGDDMDYLTGYDRTIAGSERFRSKTRQSYNRHERRLQKEETRRMTEETEK